MKKSNKKSDKKSNMKSKKMGGEKKPFKKFRDTTEQMAILDSFLSGKSTEATTLKELQESYCPLKMNLEFKKQTLDKLKKGEIEKDVAEKKLNLLFKLKRPWIEKNNNNKKSNNKKSNNKKINNKKSNNKTNNV